MRHMAFGLASIIGMFGFALPVLASTITVSQDPAYANGPFQFYCSPFVNSFENNKHYLPADGSCNFSLPASMSGHDKLLAVYKGVQGTSTRFTNDTVSQANTATLMQFFPVSFTGQGAVQDTNFIGAIIDYSNPTLGDAIDTYIQHGGTLPPGAVLNQNFVLISWKYGTRPPNEYNPVIIIPDILDTWQTDSGGVVDPIFHTYQNLIDSLVANGYVQNQTLFTLPYNWEQGSASTSAALAAKIQIIKSACNCNQVDLVAHGTGGFAALQYLESATYGKDIDQAIFVGTPLSGAPAAYQAWEGGQIHFGNSIQDGLMQVFLSAEATSGGFNSVFSYLRGTPSLGMQELLPIAPSANYLNAGAVVPPSNHVLENIINGTIPNLRTMRFVLGDSGLNNTTSGFTVGASTQPPLWPEGQPTNTQLAAGDSLVPRSSIENILGSADKNVTSTHLGLPTAAESDILQTLTGKNPTTLVTTAYPVGCVLFFSTTANSDIQVVDPSNARLGKNFTNSTTYAEIPSSVYSGFNAPTEYVAIANPLAGQYVLQTQGQSNSTITINASDVCGSSVVTTSTTTTPGPGGTSTYGITVGTNTPGITIVGINTKAPITVTADSKTISLGGTVPALTATLSGFVNNETLATSNITGNPSCSTTATASSPVGSYPITCSVGTLSSNTYEFKTFVAGTLSVVYRWDGFLQPINDTGHQVGQDLSVFKAGSTVPVKLQLKNAAGTVIQSATLPQWLTPTKLGTMSSVVDESTYTDPPSSGNTYSADGSQYKYNWSTKGLASGFWYRIYAKFDDGTTATVVIGLK
jgi:hypothetical protein